MFTHKITYQDFNGVERTEDFHFHLSLPETTRIEAEIGKGLEEHTKELVANGDLGKLLGFLEDVILNAYGKKTTDGRSFQKSAAIRSEFEHSQAYAEFFEQLLTTPDLARRFGAGVADNGKSKKNSVSPTVVQQ